MAAWYGKRNSGRVTTPLKVAPTPENDVVYDSGSEKSEPEVCRENSDMSCKDHDNGLMTCEEHPDMELDMYCIPHDSVICKVCAGLHHSGCKEIQAISEMTGKLVKRKDIKYYAKKLSGVKDNMLRVRQSKQEELKTIEHDTNKAINDIAEFRTLIDNVLDRMEKKGKALIQKRQRELSKDVQEDIDKCNEIIEALEKRLKRLKNSCDVNSAKAFVEVKKRKETVRNARQLAERLKGNSVTGMIKFTVDPKVETFARNLSWYGKDRTYLSFEPPPAFPHLYQVKNHTQFDIRAKGDQGICNVVDMCQLANGTVLLADAPNRRIKQLDVLYQLVDCLEVLAEPTSVAVMDEDRALVALDMNGHSLIHIVDTTFKLKLCDSFVIPKRCSAMACSREGIFVASAGAVYMYSLKGELLKEIYSNQSSVISSMTLSSDMTKIYLIDPTRGLVAIATDGEELGVTKDDSLKGACFVTTGSGGQLITSGQDSHVISQFNHDLSYLGVISTGNTGFRQPHALSFDRLNTRLIVTTKVKNVIKVFELK